MTKRTLQSRLTIYRRHAAKCSNQGNLQGCECPLWVHGKLRGKFVQRALDTRSLAVADIKKDALLRGGPDDDDPTPGGIRLVEPHGAVTLEAAAADFLASKKRKSAHTYELYRRATAHFRRFAEVQDLVLLRQITTAHVRDYFAAHGRWLPTTAQGRLTNLRVWFNYCLKPSRRWIEYSPFADSDLVQSDSTNVERRPFAQSEIAQILGAIEAVPADLRGRARALILLLLYTGMRISDVTFFERAYLTTRSTADYYVIKTRVPIALPPEVQPPALAALAALPASRVYYFQPDRDDDYRDARNALRGGHEFARLMPDYRVRIQQATRLVTMVLSLAGITGFRASACHRFRDTFAINMLVGGADIYTVSKLLGHSDVSITDRHYMKLVAGYRERMSASTRVLSYPLAG